MKLFDKLFGSNKTPAPEHAVIVHFDYGLEDLQTLYDLENELISILTDRNIGEFDGHEIGIDLTDVFLYMYGPNAERLFLAVKPTLEATPFLKGATVSLRFGPPEDGVKEIKINL